MTEQNVSVIARMKAQQGKESQVRQELAALIGPTRSEPGCISYILHESAEDQTSFMFYEHWADKKDLDEHLKKPYIKTFMDRAAKLLDGPVRITLWKTIE
jgi:quinol monooxygenase YgiN